VIKKYIIQENDTLRDIAKRFYANPNMWVKLAIDNNLEYPYVGRIGEGYNGKVLYPGDSIMLSFTNDESESIYFTERNVSNINYLDMLMGTDIGLVNGQLALVGGNEGFDFYTVKGSFNIKQAIQHKFKVIKGGLFYYPDYGTKLPTYIGNITDMDAIEMVKAEAARTILEDLRVESLSSIQAEYDGHDSITISAGLQLVGNFVTSIAIKIDGQNSVIIQ